MNKHIAKVEGVPLFNSLWTVMTSRYIRAQVLAHMKSHDERIGLLMSMSKSAQIYGHGDPVIVFSDDPVKVCNLLQYSPQLMNCINQDKQLVYTAFPSSSKNLTPIAIAHGLEPLSIPDTGSVTFLANQTLIGSYTIVPACTLGFGQDSFSLCQHGCRVEHVKESWSINNSNCSAL